VNLATVRKNGRQTIRLPDIDPQLLRQWTGPVPLTAALKSAGFSIGVLVFFLVMIVGWPQLAKLQRGQQVEISAAARHVTSGSGAHGADLNLLTALKLASWGHPTIMTRRKRVRR